MREGLVIGSLFAGIGGFDLAARWMGWRTAWFSEIDPYASRVLAKHWPGVPNHGDITTIDFTAVEPVDMLCGGFPCQDISNAGKREGITGARSGLWTEYARAIRELRPRYVVVENVAALAHRGLDVVLGDLAQLGYDAEWTVLPACAVGAPHTRARLWVIAHAERDEQPWAEPCGWQAGRMGREHQPLSWDRDWQDTLRKLRGMDDGLSYRMERTDTLRNAIVPQCAFVIFQRIAAVMARAAAPERVA